MGSDTEFSADAEVPLTDVHRAAHEFMTTGTRPTLLTCQTDELTETPTRNTRR